jgi:hypothetical protein
MILDFDWQDIVAVSIVFAAAASLARRAWRKMSARRPVVGCTHCSACSSGGEKQLVTVTSGIAESTSGDRVER